MSALISAPDLKGQTALNYFQGLTFAYHDTEHCRRKDGVLLPDTTPEVVARLNKGLPWADWGGIRLSQDRCFFVRPNGKPLIFSTVRRILGETDQTVRRVLPYLSCPNGQVKNFLNACRAVGTPFNQMKIAIAGSKSMEGSGSWHFYFLKFLLSYQCNIIVDFFDYAERSDVKVLSCEQGNIFAEWIPEPFVISDQNNYDLIIDDTWVFSEGPGLKLLYTGRYSWKGREDGEPFLHFTETRTFSEPPKEIVKTGCQCPVCRVIKECVETYDQYIVLRTYCARLGYDVECAGIDNLTELKKVAECYRVLLASPSVDIRLTHARYLISLSEEIGLEVEGTRVTRTGEPRFQNFSRFRQGQQIFRQETLFQGRHVVFAGVAPAVLKHVKTTRHGLAEILFVNSIDTWRMHSPPPIVYCGVPPKEVAIFFPQYEFSGRMHEGFYEYVKMKPPSKLMQEKPVKPSQVSVNSFYNPLTIYPFSKVVRQLKSRALPKKDFELLSPVFSNRELSWNAFEPHKWRTSIYLNLDGSWGMAKSVIELVGQREGFLQLSIPLPWDMTYKEVQEIEKRYLTPDEFILRKECRGRILTKRSIVKSPKDKTSRIKDANVLPDKIKDEWIVAGSRRVRSDDVHPVSWVYLDPGIEEIVSSYLKKYGYLEGYREIRTYLERLKLSKEPKE
jgi:hypothetical protein